MLVKINNNETRKIRELIAGSQRSGYSESTNAIRDRYQEYINAEDDTELIFADRAKLKELLATRNSTFI